jgi:hypothetical protein
VLVLFQVSDPAVAEREQDILINDRSIVSVEALFRTATAGGDSFPMPDGSIISLSDKKKWKVKQTPREVATLIRQGGGR